MLGMLLVTLSDTAADHRWALKVVSGVGLVGFGVMFALFRYIENDSRRPGEDRGGDAAGVVKRVAAIGHRLALVVDRRGPGDQV